MKQRPFLFLWTLAVIATVAAFVLHLGLRGKIVDLGYRLGRERAEQARLREVKRVLSLEAASYETPQRVEMVARTLLGMNPPPPERIIVLKAVAPILPPEESEGSGDEGPNVPKPDPTASASAAPTDAAPAVVPSVPVADPALPLDPIDPLADPSVPFPPGLPGDPAPANVPAAVPPNGDAP